MKIYFRIIIALFSILLIYLTLVILDILLPRLETFNENYNEALKIIAERRLTEDAIFLNSTEGEMLVYPEWYSYYPYNEIVHKNGIAPVGGIPYQNVALCNEGYGLVEYTSDRFGFRNKDELWNNLEQIDAIVIGDSSIGGDCNHEEATLTGILNNSGQKTLNLGLGGFSSISYHTIGKIFIPVIEPKNVVIVFHSNDNHMITNTIYNKYLESMVPEIYFDLSQDVIKPSKKLNLFNTELQQLVNSAKNEVEYPYFDYNSKFKHFISKFEKYLMLVNIRKFLFYAFSDLEEPIGDHTLLIDYAENLCIKHNCETNYVLIKGSSFWTPEFYHEKYKNSLDRYLKKYNKSLIHTHELFNDNRKYWSIKGGHLSPLGNKLLAKEIIKKF
tara:strand:- start:631 stop:1788 length:1158 start_codon:yes stop_codon:yes gene_type:complete